MTDNTENVGREEDYRRLRTSEIRYRRLFEAARDGILIIDAVSRKITDVNPFMEDLLGYSREEILGRELWEIGLLGDVEASHRAFRHLQESGYIRYEDLPLQTKGGERREVEFVSNVYVEDGNRVVQCNIRDVTDRKRSEEELVQLMIREQVARASAETANRSKDEFLAIVSHELRTPLTAILGMSALLRTKRFEDLPRAAAMIERNARVQAQLIEDLLDLSRITAGKLRLEVQPIGLAAVIDAAIDSVRHVADSKNVQIHAELDGDMGLVSGDANRLQQVIWNLLANAVKFSPAGGLVRVVLERGNHPSGLQAQIVVSDKGEGIRADFIPFVFDRFSQGDTSITKAHGGLGLGLAIARDITELHGGTIHVDGGGPGSGAVFTVRLPLIPAQDEPPVASRDERGHGSRTFERTNLPESGSPLQ